MDLHPDFRDLLAEFVRCEVKLSPPAVRKTWPTLLSSNRCVAALPILGSG